MPRLRIRAAAEIGVARRVEYAQHQRGGVVADRDLDLRQRARGSRARRSALPELRDQAADRLDQDVAALQVGEQRTATFAKSHQHPALRSRRSCSPAARGADSTRPGRPAAAARLRRLHAADALEFLCDQPLLGRPAARLREMLQRAAAADAEVRTARRRPAAGEASSTSTTTASSCCRRRRMRRRRTRSPGSAPSTNTVLPSMRATPRPSWSSRTDLGRFGRGGRPSRHVPGSGECAASALPCAPRARRAPARSRSVVRGVRRPRISSKRR